MRSDRSLSEAADQISIATLAVVERNGHHLKAAPLHDVCRVKQSRIVAGVERRETRAKRCYRKAVELGFTMAIPGAGG